MLKLLFVGVSPTYSISLPPARGYAIAGDELRTVPDGLLTARFNGATWEVQNQFFTQFECGAGKTVQIRLEDEQQSDLVGAVSNVIVSGGAIWANGTLVALRCPDKFWRCMSTRSVWPRVVLLAADAPAPLAH